MKQLLRKILFWDAPAKGAFFVVTLLFTLPRFFGAILFDIVLPIFLRGGKAADVALILMLALIGGALVYALVVFPRFMHKESMTRKKVAIAVCVCAVIMCAFWGIAPEGYSHLWWVFPVALVLFGCVYSLYPAVKVWEWVIAIVTLVAGAGVFPVMNIWDAREYARGMGLIQTTGGFFSFLGHSTGMQWGLTIGAILLLVISYLQFGRIISKGGGVPFRGLFGKGVATLWILFVGMYLASACLALVAMRDCQNARRELDAYWGMTVTTKTLIELYGKNGNINQAFWDEFTSLEVDFPEFYKKYDGISLLDGYPDAVLPPGIYAEWKGLFNECAELRRSEEMLAETMPLPERRHDFYYDEFHHAMLSRCRCMTRWELWRVRLALEDKEIESAKKALLRIDNLCAPLMADYNEVSGLVWMAIEPMRAKALCQILSSGLADEAWLREQDAILQEKERQIADVQKRMVLGHAASIIGTMDSLVESISYASFLVLPEGWGWLWREWAVLARDHCIDDFADFPEHPMGFFARMLSSGLRLIGTRKIPELKATLRVSRGLIEAELARLMTGAYPAELENLPEDPFTGKPLRYAIGECKISEHHFGLNEEKEEGKEAGDMIHAVQKHLGLTDEWAKEMRRPKKNTFKTEYRMVNAVQIWSVGYDGISGDTSGEDDAKKSRDDFRFYIRVQGDIP